MTDFQSRPSAPRQNPPEEPSEPKGLARLQAAISRASGLTKNLAAAGAMVVFVVVASWLVAEQVMLWWKTDHTLTTAKRDFLCNKHAYTIALPDQTAPTASEGESEATRAVAIAQASAQMAQLRQIQDKVLEIYNLKELARQHAIPFDTVGRVRHFLRCGRVTDVTATTVKFTLSEGERKPYSQDLKALYDWENAGFEFVSNEFSDVVPPIILGAWRQRLDTLKGALSKIETTVAPVATDAQLAAADKGAAPPIPRKQLVLVKPDAEDIETAWLLITASDINQSAALSEVKDLRQALTGSYKAALGGEGSTTLEFSPRTETAVKDYVAMYKTGGRIRTVVAFKDRESANIARQVLQQEGLIRLDAYTRNVAAWCAGKPKQETTTTDGPPLYDCS